jgi:pimeloyl-ACP methyl ester carboxylesterase/membrane protein DedA with SNARE-associated domain
VILLHGSPGDNREVAGIAQGLGPTRRAIAPDLPGFGGSTWSVPDYSIEAHARYLSALLDSLRLDRVHLVGFSMGGGVVLHLADQEPERVASITLLSSIGAQEYELLGDYHLNHAIHGLQLAGLWFLENGIPHFGRLDGGMLTAEYARNFYDTDQRPLRALLARYHGPALVIHGDKDPLVDPAVAIESHRLLPQSTLALFTDDRANHFLAFQRPDTLASLLTGFFDQVETGRAPTRATASPDRVAAAAAPFDPATLPPVVGLALAVLLLLIAGSTLLSEDLACIATGLLVARGTVGLAAGTAACYAGIVIGDLWLYGMGRWLGRPALRRAPLRWFVSEAAIERSAAWFARRGLTIVLLTRFVPGTRLPTYLAAGILRAGAGRFLAAFLIAAALWTPLLVGASALFGDQVLTRFIAYQGLALPAVLGLAVVLVVLVKLIVPAFSWRGRRLLLSRWRRITRWEFWPRWVFYPPIVLHVFWLILKHRSLTLLSAVNPAIPGGGLVGESKSEILAGLAANPDRVAPWLLLPRGDRAARLAALESFYRTLDPEATSRPGSEWKTPIVLKPDIGERGDGVAIVRSESEASQYLDQTDEPVIAQRYIPGVEFGIFYYRIPGQERGRIFAITEKRFPTVTGDGHSTLERLILSDDRAVSRAKLFLARHAARLDQVPPPGVVIPLVELGTHCRGSIFLDGAWIQTPALETAIDQLSRDYPGFWFGRYDVRAPTAAALQSATDWQVIELNGATSEATSIYDPRNSLARAYRVLRRQWSLLFEIAARNVAGGARPATIRELLALVDRHRQAKAAHPNWPGSAVQARPGNELSPNEPPL